MKLGRRRERGRGKRGVLNLRGEEKLRVGEERGEGRHLEGEEMSVE